MKINKQLIMLIYFIFTVVVVVLCGMEISYSGSFYSVPLAGRTYDFPPINYYLLNIWFYLTGLLILLMAYRYFKRKNWVWIFFLLFGLVWLFLTRYIIFFLGLIISPTV
jgi:hypothetical protein